MFKGDSIAEGDEVQLVVRRTSNRGPGFESRRVRTFSEVIYHLAPEDLHPGWL